LLQQKRPLALVILDGWGYSTIKEANAIELARTPFYDEIREQYPQTLLETSGPRVGLPVGVMGNSEVGHLSIGSGRIIRMDVSRIDHAIETGAFFANETLVAAMDAAKNGALHLMGLLSDGQVHSHNQHLYALLRMAKQRGLERVFVHCFLDGRDTPPASGAGFVAELQKQMEAIGCGRVASVCGRYYAMDRDTNWTRTERAYNLLVKGKGAPASDPVAAIRESYERGMTDEFIEPIAIAPAATLADGDSVIFYNFRPDRARQITRALMIEGFNGFDITGRPRLSFACMTQYDATFGLPVAFAKQTHRNTLVQLFAAQGVRNFRCAETEKYAHVTYFFNGGVEAEYACESRLLVPSPKVPTYDLLPEMSAFKVTDKVLRSLDEGQEDVYIINFANCDMVGHTGKLDKSIEAVQYVDTCLGWLTKALRARGGACLITADHGNCEQMIDYATGQPHTAHTTNPVPLHLVGEDYRGLKLRPGGALEDLAPTMLAMLGMKQPEEMTGQDLRESSNS
jgi:2,3-bisphosphoglycerate-independent phosphoglycerate mutase